MSVKMGKQQQMQTFLEAIENHNQFDINTLGWSEATAYRYLKEAKERYGLHYQKDQHIIRGKLEKPRITESKAPHHFGKKVIMQYQLLSYIASYSRLSRKQIIHYCQSHLADISEREVDQWVKSLCEDGMVEKIRLGKQIAYKFLGSKEDAEEERIRMIQNLTHFHALLPNTYEVNNLYHKLGILDYVNVKNRALSSFHIFSVLQDAIRKDVGVVLETKPEKCTEVLPLYMFYNMRTKKWYLRYTKNSKKSKVSHYLLLNDQLKWIRNTECLISKEQVEALYKQARKEDNLAFASVFEKGIAVKVLFENLPFVMDKARKRLLYFGTFRAYNDHWICFEGTIHGYHDFMKWLRAFGSSVVILKPESARKQMIESTKEVLAYYESQ